MDWLHYLMGIILLLMFGIALWLQRQPTTLSENAQRIIQLLQNEDDWRTNKFWAVHQTYNIAIRYPFFEGIEIDETPIQLNLLELWIISDEVKKMKTRKHAKILQDTLKKPNVPPKAS